MLTVPRVFAEAAEMIEEMATAGVLMVSTWEAEVLPVLSVT